MTKKAPAVKPLSLHHPISCVAATCETVCVTFADLDKLIVKIFGSVIMSLKIFWQIVRKKNIIKNVGQPTTNPQLQCEM